MQSLPSFLAVYPIGESDPMDLPVPDLDAALPFYTAQMGFAVVSRGDQPCQSAHVRRGGVVLRLAENGGDPEQASCYIEVADADAVYEEYLARGLDASPLREEAHGGGRQRVFFVRAPDGLCYCIGATVRVPH